MRMLIVDDSIMMCDRLRDYTEVIPEVEIVGVATNGIEALDMIKDKNPELIILDIRMPGMSGISILEKLKEEGNNCKICIFTNYPYYQYKQKCIKMGADYFFDKTKDFKEVINLVTELSLNKEFK